MATTIPWTSNPWPIWPTDAPLCKRSAGSGVAFDGANIWVSNLAGNNVTKLRASDGTVAGTFSVGTSPTGLAFDGANIWVANVEGNTVTKLRASDGAVLATFPVPKQPERIAFDGANIWVTDFGNNTISKL